MLADIVFPDGNEKELIEIAGKLGYKALVFAYENIKEMPKSMPKGKVKIVAGIVGGLRGDCCDLHGYSTNSR